MCLIKSGEEVKENGRSDVRKKKKKLMLMRVGLKG